MNYEYYKVFYAVAVHKNITRAAEELYSSQPAVSRVISNMETELNCKLFIRGKTGVKLTKEGEELFERISEPCGKLMRADADFIKFVKLNESTVYIGATVTALYCYLFDFLEKYRKKHPDVHFKIHTGSSSKLIADLKKGKLDVVFNTTPFFGAETLNVSEVCKFRDILVAGSDYKGLEGKSITLNDLKRFPVILLSQGMSFRAHVDEFFNRNGVHIAPELEADSSALIMPLVEKNWGVSLVPEKMAGEYVTGGKVVKLDLVESMPFRYVTMVTDKTKTLNKPVYEIFRMIKGEKQNV